MKFRDCIDSTSCNVPQALVHILRVEVLRIVHLLAAPEGSPAVATAPSARRALSGKAAAVVAAGGRGRLAAAVASGTDAGLGTGGSRQCRVGALKVSEEGTMFC